MFIGRCTTVLDEGKGGNLDLVQVTETSTNCECLERLRLWATLRRRRQLQPDLDRIVSQYASTPSYIPVINFHTYSSG